MTFKEIRKVLDGAFIHRYDIVYETRDNKEKIYEMISRKKELRDLEQIKNSRPDAVVLILHDATGEHILLNREFRLAVGDWVYNFPAGLMEKGESPETAAARELREETGLTLDTVKDIIHNSYSAIGFSDEKNVCIVGTASGTIRESDSTVEEIEAGWFTKEEVRNLLKTEMFAARTQSYCYLWSN